MKRASEVRSQGFPWREATVPMASTEAARIQLAQDSPAAFGAAVQSADESFRLTGPGVNVATSVRGRATSTREIVLRIRTYRYQSARRTSRPGGRFTVLHGG